MGIFGSGGFLDSLIGGSKASTIGTPQASVSGQFQDIFLANYFFPQLFSYLDAANQAGEGGSALSGITKSGKSIPTGVDDINFDALNSALPGMKAKASQAQAQNFQKTYDTFSKIPALSDIFSKAAGNVDSTGALAKIFGDLSGSALGSVANTGFLSDPTKQANTLGPLALQKYQIEQSIQQSNQAQALGLVGAGGLPSSGLFGMNMGGPSPWTQGTLGAAGMFGSPNLSAAFGVGQFNAGAQNAMSQFNAGILGFSAGGGGGSAEGQVAGIAGLLAL